MHNRLLTKVRSKKTLQDAWQVIQRNGLSSKSVETRNEIRRFGSDASVHLDRIQRQLQTNRFKFRPAKGIRAKKPGKNDFRPLVVAPIESRIVQRAILDVLISVPSIEALVGTPHSFGGIKSKKEDPLSGVQAAIFAVLEAIKNGGKYVVRTDISGFFTKIPKSDVRQIIGSHISELSFLNLYDDAVALELENMSSLRGDAYKFPIEDIGVAQGNSLSPLLGNILLRQFDLELNSIPKIRCIRYIDDFILLGPNRKATMKAFKRAREILSNWNMTLAVEKTDEGTVHQKFQFLGIEFNNGFIRPTEAKRREIVESVKEFLETAKVALYSYKSSATIEKKWTVTRTLATLSDTLYSWGIHYSFCNDVECLKLIDAEIAKNLNDYLQTFRAVYRVKGVASMNDLLGILSLEAMERKSFDWQWPKTSSVGQT